MTTPIDAAFIARCKSRRAAKAPLTLSEQDKLLRCAEAVVAWRHTGLEGTRNMLGIVMDILAGRGPTSWP